jgi:hypothetical protein
MLRTFACLASLAGALAFASPAVAAGGKSGGGSTSTISLAQPSASLAAASTAAWPRWGDFVSFDVLTADAYPYVNLNCYQGGALVSQTWEGYFDGALGDRMFGLYSPVWTGGAADCTADLKGYTSKGWKQLATTSFHVEA